MKAKKLIAAGIAASMSMLTLAGCGTAGNTGNSGGDTAKEDTVKEDTAIHKSGNPSDQHSNLSKKEMPTLFNVNGRSSDLSLCA